MFVRKKEIKGRIYYYICKVNSQGKQKVIKYLGTIKKILEVYSKVEMDRDYQKHKIRRKER